MGRAVACSWCIEAALDNVESQRQFALPVLFQSSCFTAKDTPGAGLQHLLSSLIILSHAENSRLRVLGSQSALEIIGFIIFILFFIYQK